MKFVCDVFNKVQGFCDRYESLLKTAKKHKKSWLHVWIIIQMKPAKGLISSVSLASLNKVKGNVGESLHSLTFYTK